MPTAVVRLVSTPTRCRRSAASNSVRLPVRHGAGRAAALCVRRKWSESKRLRWSWSNLLPPPSSLTVSTSLPPPYTLHTLYRGGGRASSPTTSWISQHFLSFLSLYGDFSYTPFMTNQCLSVFLSPPVKLWVCAAESAQSHRSDYPSLKMT